ncbi:MAG TPA: helix-turn-helix transcriptional regulator, partial [Polyangiaceae bacterium]
TLEQTRPALSTGGETAEGSVDRVLLAQAWASARLEAGLTLRQWAAAVKWHPVHFERVFKRATGQSPMKWLEDRRMQAARQYLSGTAKSVAEVASAVGYADSFYFSRVFRKHFGRAPAKYRKLSFELTPME